MVAGLVPRDYLMQALFATVLVAAKIISFDLRLIEQIGCNVFGFDATPQAIKYVRERVGHHEKYYFADLGLWDKKDVLKFYAPRNSEHVSHSLLNLQQTEDYFEARVERLSDIMRHNGHEKLDLLKLDIEAPNTRSLTP
jgi:FkbM family methyltransferase